MQPPQDTMDLDEILILVNARKIESEAMKLIEEDKITEAYELMMQQQGNYGDAPRIVGEELMKAEEYEKAVDMYHLFDPRFVEREFGKKINELMKEQKNDAVIKLVGVLKSKGIKKVYKP